MHLNITFRRRFILSFIKEHSVAIKTVLADESDYNMLLRKCTSKLKRLLFIAFGGFSVMEMNDPRIEKLCIYLLIHNARNAIISK